MNRREVPIRPLPLESRCGILSQKSEGRRCRELDGLYPPLWRRDSLHRLHQQSARRLEAHQSGKGAKYTRSRPPVELVYREGAPDKSAALRREIAIKRLDRRKKLALIAGGGNPGHGDSAAEEIR